MYRTWIEKFSLYEAEQIKSDIFYCSSEVHSINVQAAERPSERQRQVLHAL